MKITFETREGSIEVTQVPGKPGTAYFSPDDILVDVQPNREFKDLNGREFRVLWPILMSQKIATLQVKEWRFLDAKESK